MPKKSVMTCFFVNFAIKCADLSVGALACINKNWYAF